MSMTINTEISSDDGIRILRYINANPVVVEKDSEEGVNHDIERYCAYKQAVLNAEEADRDPAYGYLSAARDCRTRLLDSIDKAITIVHLLTNTTWGPGVPATRFLSCRQSGPLRTVVGSAGDRNIAWELLKAVNSTKVDISSEMLRFDQLKSLYDSLCASKFLVELRTLPSGSVLVVDLMPLSVSREISACVIGTDGSIELDPKIRHYVDNRFSLQIHHRDVPEAPSMVDKSLLCPLEEISLAQQCVVDYLLVLELLDDPVDECKNGWLRVSKSRNIDRFGVEFVSVANFDHRVWIGLSKGKKIDEKIQNLRNIFLNSRKGRFSDLVF